MENDSPNWELFKLGIPYEVKIEPLRYKWFELNLSQYNLDDPQAYVEFRSAQKYRASWACTSYPFRRIYSRINSLRIR